LTHTVDTFFGENDMFLCCDVTWRLCYVRVWWKWLTKSRAWHGLLLNTASLTWIALPFTAGPMVRMTCPCLHHFHSLLTSVTIKMSLEIAMILLASCHNILI